MKLLEYLVVDIDEVIVTEFKEEKQEAGLLVLIVGAHFLKLFGKMPCDPEVLLICFLAVLALYLFQVCLGCIFWPRQPYTRKELYKMCDHFEIRCEGPENEIVFATRGEHKGNPGILRVKIKNCIYVADIPFTAQKVLIDKEGKLFIDGKPKRLPKELYTVSE